MEALLYEYLIEYNQLELFKIWLVEQGVGTEKEVEGYVDDELEHLNFF
jgi:hypothetical protein